MVTLYVSILHAISLSPRNRRGRHSHWVYQLDLRSHSVWLVASGRHLGLKTPDRSHCLISRPALERNDLVGRNACDHGQHRCSGLLQGTRVRRKALLRATFTTLLWPSARGRELLCEKWKSLRSVNISKFLKMLTRLETFSATILRWQPNVKLGSIVAPRYTGRGPKFSFVPLCLLAPSYIVLPLAFCLQVFQRDSKSSIPWQRLK